MNKRNAYIILTITVIALVVALIALQPELSLLQISTMVVSMLVLYGMSLLLVNFMFNQMQLQAETMTRQVSDLEHALSSAQQQLIEIATIDEVTGCANQKHFLEMLERHRAMAVRSQYHFSIAVCRVDQFDNIVAEHSLSRGNEVLQLFSRIAAAALREVDLVARLEGDQFALLLAEAATEDALAVVDRIGELVGQVEVREAADLRLTASGGIATWGEDDSVDDLMAHAREALHLAIAEGGDCVAGYVVPEEARTSA
ncbi:MAG: GGDEF domain-containing protein [Pseudomonadota bacterium]